MSIFSKMKRRSNSGVQPCEAITILDSFNSFVPEIVFSKKFMKDTRNPEKAEKSRLRGKHYDWLLFEKRDAVIDADAKAEIESIRRQHLENERRVFLYAASVKSETDAARAQLSLIEKEISDYDNTEQKILAEMEAKRK